MEDVKKRERILLPLSKLECGPQEINSREIRLQLEEARQSLKKREFILKVFAAVAPVDAKAPYLVL